MGLHHTSDPVCPLCQAKLKSAHPFLRQWFNERVKPRFPLAHVSWSWRGEDDQEQAYLDGKTKLHWPKSPHNRTVNGKPEAAALDLFEIDENHQARFNPGFYVQINQMNDRVKEPIFWGGRFKTFGDGDHFQLEPFLLHQASDHEPPR